MIKQSKLSKICWAFVYLTPLLFAFLEVFLTGSPADGITNYPSDVFGDLSLPYFTIEFFSVRPLVDFISENTALFLDQYLGYLVLVSIFRIVWKVLVYLPDVVGKLIDRWSL